MVSKIPATELIDSQHPLPFHHHRRKHLCIVPPAQVPVSGCKIGHACKGVRMIVSQHLLPLLHHHHLERLCVFPAVLVPVCGCKISHTCKGVRMIVSQQLLP